ncbi:hypothetical protein BURC_01331 [Burkholderiaceae bacterium]|nr:hypothetical protein BURC_01331 [Burkholderiaceae bacterium]
MSRRNHVYGWDEEPADERPSEFVPTSGYSALSGYHVPRDLSARVSRRRRGGGLTRLVIATLVLLVACGVAIQQFAKILSA